ncbi:PAS domain S-box protein [Hyphomicrobium sp.]|uniref:PAS domain S-box protein n=1 Tax=Hyphomicrobium sp. TaxID=82 RepID=UPI002C459090|nr:PAS domain S-box protein [Hyphomicrobium sp.]HVZ05992.1 PAS domain S-box protein [Hyphomicrobium sp.]
MSKKSASACGLKLSRLDATLPVGVYICDRTGVLTDFNRRCATFWASSDITPGAKLTDALKAYLPNGQRLPEAHEPTAIVLRTESAIHGCDLVFERPDGSRVLVEVGVDPIFDDSQNFLGAVGCIQDFSKYADISAQVSQGQKAETENENSDSSIQSSGVLAARLAAIVASSDDAIVSKTLQGFVTTWNAGAERIFGYTADEMIGQHITRIIPIELRSEEDAILARLRQGEHVDHFETVRVAKDGRRIDVSLTVSPIRDRTGRVVGASKVGRDITERKQFERLQQLLIGELNHRVKNTLATVQSIANQTVHRAKSPSDFAASFSGRLQALARTHTLLTQSTWQAADLADVLRDQLPLSEAADDRISYSGPTVKLNAQAALHLGLVLHELATNALKYGALSDPRGKLAIHWIVRTDNGRHLLLEWRERGGPTVSVPQSRGFGATLIEKSLEAHGGVTSIRYEAEGLTCEINLPLPDVDSIGGGSYNKPLASGVEIAKAARMYAGKTPAVAGKRILVVDDEPLIAMDIVASLEDEGCKVVGPAATLKKALHLIETEDIDAGLLDANLAGEPVDALAAVLTRRKIPFAFVSGYGREGLPEAFRQTTLIKKPFHRQRLMDVVQQMLSEASTIVPLRKSI